MQVQIAYGFELEQDAYRFLNALRHWSVAEVDARYHHAPNCVKVTYHYQDTGFDVTSSALDDLAAEYGGREVPL